MKNTNKFTKRIRNEEKQHILFGKETAESRFLTSHFRSELAGKNDNFSFTWSKFVFKHGNWYYTLQK